MQEGKDHLEQQPVEQELSIHQEHAHRND
jgi:hypothetical protein